jgi:glucose/arabinose dehydrogenase
MQWIPFASWKKSRSRTPSRPLQLETLEDRCLLTTLPPGFSELPVVGGLSSPTSMAFAPDGRLFITEQPGRLRIVENGTLLPTPFLTLNVVSSGERGLLCVTFDPNFTSNHFLYVYYTVPGSPAHNRISRFTANGDTAVAGREVDLFDLDPLSSATNHNGGSLHFGIDGKLYVGVGENANPSNSQSLNTDLGKFLRINPDGSIPTDNPFYTQTAGNNRAIWALGLRNPFTFAVQPGTGLIFINDVGQNTWEEVNEGMAGANYGWPVCEGVCNMPGFVDPIYAYNHNGASAAITGGVFYEASQFPAAYRGQYFLSDYILGFIRMMNPANHQVTGFATGAVGPVDLDVGPDGDLYYLSVTKGLVNKIAWTLGPDQSYVTGLYQDLLHRAPDTNGLNAWVAQLQAGASRQQVVNGLWTSAEHRGLEVDSYYVTYLHRAADSAGHQAWVNAFLSGASEVAVQEAFLTSAEYTATHADNTTFVNGLYADVLGRAPDTAGQAAHIQELQNGARRSSVAGEFLTSAEKDLQIINSYYQDYLRRTASNAEQQGWLQQMESGATPQLIGEQFLASDEYFAKQQ